MLFRSSTLETEPLERIALTSLITSVRQDESVADGYTPLLGSGGVQPLEKLAGPIQVIGVCHGADEARGAILGTTYFCSLILGAVLDSILERTPRSQVGKRTSHP